MKRQKNISKDFKRKYPNIDWKSIAGMRDKLIHHYFGVDLNLAFKIVQHDIPVLKKEILKMLDDMRVKKLL